MPDNGGINEYFEKRGPKIKKRLAVTFI